MSKLKQLIGLQTSNLSVRALACALGLSIGAVSKYLQAVRAAAISAADAESLSEAELEQRVFRPTAPLKANGLMAPDCAWIHNELKRHRHVTLQLLWKEYAERLLASEVPLPHRALQALLPAAIDRAEGAAPIRRLAVGCSSITPGAPCRSMAATARSLSARNCS